MGGPFQRLNSGQAQAFEELTRRFAQQQQALAPPGVGRQIGQGLLETLIGGPGFAFGASMGRRNRRQRQQQALESQYYDNMARLARVMNQLAPVQQANITNRYGADVLNRLAERLPGYTQGYRDPQGLVGQSQAMTGFPTTTGPRTIERGFTSARPARQDKEKGQMLLKPGEVVKSGRRQPKLDFSDQPGLAQQLQGGISQQQPPPLIPNVPINNQMFGDLADVIQSTPRLAGTAAQRARAVTGGAEDLAGAQRRQAQTAMDQQRLAAEVEALRALAQQRRASGAATTKRADVAQQRLNFEKLERSLPREAKASISRLKDAAKQAGVEYKNGMFERPEPPQGFLGFGPSPEELQEYQRKAQAYNDYVLRLMGETGQVLPLAEVPASRTRRTRSFSEFSNSRGR